MILRVVHHNADPDGIMSATLAKYLYRKDNLMFLGLTIWETKKPLTLWLNES